MLRAHTVARRTIELREDPRPAPLPGHALVRVHHVALCGTDLHIWDDDYPAGLPLVQGHEFSGIVEEVWPAAEDPAAPAPGTPVAVSPMVYCGECGPCRADRYNVCESISCLGCYEDGALAELVRVPLDKLCVLPEGLPLGLAALGEPASIAMQAVNRGEPVPGETALVLGCGPIGLFATLYLAELGVAVLAADTVPSRLQLAESLGATGFLVGAGPFPTPGQQQAFDRACTAAGPTLVIEATGVPASFENAVRLAAPTGRIVQVGISTRSAQLSLRDVPFKELDIRGSRNSRNLIPDALSLIAAHQDQVRRLVTHRFQLADISAAFQAMSDPAEQAGKIVVDLPAADTVPAEARQVVEAR
ncbi:zinc-dependent alcohol dehydrogenase [Arthrobacter sp. USHLN218]|uniref:zinc-dependent alcohol dehydrogenase n=1 Tax=Arthrobacter sp. USHLN218 TaxID=3081232 RepID=UPI0030165175